MSDFWQGRRVFVTGVTGVVGSWVLKDLLGNGACVVGLVWNAEPEGEAHWNGNLRDVRIEHGNLVDFHLLEGKGLAAHASAEALQSTGRLRVLHADRRRVGDLGCIRVSMLRSERRPLAWRLHPGRPGKLPRGLQYQQESER